MKKSMEKLFVSQLREVRGGLDGGITSEDDWEAPVASYTFEDGGITSEDDWEAPVA